VSEPIEPLRIKGGPFDVKIIDRGGNILSLVTVGDQGHILSHLTIKRANIRPLVEALLAFA
jgi:hypothetical protein